MKKVLTIKDNSTLRDSLKRIKRNSKSNFLPNFFAIIDKNKKLIGALTDGDLRRNFAENDSMDKSIKLCMNKNPVFLTIKQLKNREFDLLKENLRKRKRNIQDIFITNENKKIIGAISYKEIFNSDVGQETIVSVIGMGFVGLTVACHIASKDFKVRAIDKNKKIIGDLKRGKPHFYEPHLQENIKINSKEKRLIFSNELKKSSYYIVSAGTPLTNKNKPDLSHIYEVLDSIVSAGLNNSVVVMRSTIPLGSSLSSIIPYLEKKSSLKCGVDWSYCYAPERTIEGNALDELKTLPQLFSGFSKNCNEISRTFLNLVFDNLVLMDSIEAAELSKLACNSYRDLSFAFANEISNICEDLQVDSKRLIEQVNYEYPRSTIALPSPGVGGYCLTKDPIIYSNPLKKLSSKPKSGCFSREINEHAAKSPYRSLIKFSKRNNLKLSDLNILVIGIAFKGFPKTDDYRFSTGVDFCNLIQNKVKKLWVKDFEIDSKKINQLGFKNLISIKKVDAIFILNNHEKNSDIVLLDWLQKKSKKLLYDGWGQKTNLKNYDDKNFFYSTLGKL